jgi:UDP-glucose 4-epimerase
MTRVSVITGGAGFVGSHLAEALVRRGDKVRVVDNLSTGFIANLESIARRIEFFPGDINDTALLDRAMQGAAVVFHQAALASVPRSVDDPLATNAACVTGTVNVLNSARRHHVGRVVYAASSSAYGDLPYSSKRETDPPQPLSPYAAAKLAGEYYCQAFTRTYGLETVGIRYFNVFGPRQDPDSPYSAVIPLFITRMMAGEPPVVYGDGHQTRDFTYVDNVVQGNLLAAEAPRAVGRVINVANGKSTSLLTLIALLNELLGTNIPPQFQAARAGDVRDSMADISLAQELLDYRPQIDFATGLQRCMDFYRTR